MNAKEKKAFKELLDALEEAGCLGAMAAGPGKGSSFNFCQGPDKAPRHMLTCRGCRTLWKMRRYWAKVEAAPRPARPGDLRGVLQGCVDELERLYHHHGRPGAPYEGKIGAPEMRVVRNARRALG